MLCACGQAIHPCFEIGGVCENCFAERAEKLHLPGCRSVYHSPATEEDCHADQIVTRRSEADRHDRRRRDISIVASHLVLCTSESDAEHSIAELRHNRPEYFVTRRAEQGPRAPCRRRQS